MTDLREIESALAAVNAALAKVRELDRPDGHWADDDPYICLTTAHEALEQERRRLAVVVAHTAALADQVESLAEEWVVAGVIADGGATYDALHAIRAQLETVVAR